MVCLMIAPATMPVPVLDQLALSLLHDGVQSGTMACLMIAPATMPVPVPALLTAVLDQLALQLLHDGVQSGTNSTRNICKTSIST